MDDRTVYIATFVDGKASLSKSVLSPCDDIFYRVKESKRIFGRCDLYSVGSKTMIDGNSAIHENKLDAIACLQEQSREFTKQAKEAYQAARARDAFLLQIFNDEFVK